MRNYNMLRAAPRIEIEVVESYNGQSVLLGRCYVSPDVCFHTQCDPQWRELFKGNPEMDEGQIFVGVQVVHNKDPLYKAQLAELIPQRTNKEQMDMAFENEVGGLQPSDRSKWSSKVASSQWMRAWCLLPTSTAARCRARASRARAFLRQLRSRCGSARSRCRCWV